MDLKATPPMHFALIPLPIAFAIKPLLKKGPQGKEPKPKTPVNPPVLPTSPHNSASSEN